MRTLFFLLFSLFACSLSAQVPKSGPIVTVICGDTIPPETWVYVDNSDGLCYPADGSDKAKAANGLVYVAGGVGDTTQMFVFGENPWQSDSLTAGITYYLSPTTPGAMTATEPQGYGFRQKLCFSLSDSVVFISRAVEADKTQTIKKPTNEARASNTTLTTDSDLQIELMAGKSYQVEVYAVINADNANMDYKYSLSFTGTTLLTHGSRGHSVTGSGAGTDKENTQYALSLPGSTAVTGATAGLAIVRASYFITVGVSGGTFGFNWAQNTTDIGNLTVYAGSWIKATEL